MDAALAGPRPGPRHGLRAALRRLVPDGRLLRGVPDSQHLPALFAGGRVLAGLRAGLRRVRPEPRPRGGRQGARRPGHRHAGRDPARLLAVVGVDRRAGLHLRLCAGLRGRSRRGCRPFRARRGHAAAGRFPTCFFISLAALAGGILNTYHRFACRGVLAGAAERRDDRLRRRSSRRTITGPAWRWRPACSPPASCSSRSCCPSCARIRLLPRPKWGWRTRACARSWA